MSYQILSRKLRPQIFDDVIGQNHIIKTLQNAISMDRVAHGYLFSGPRGVGKTTIARILAKTLNCENSLNNNPCNKCSNCKDITKGNNLNVQELDGASNRGIDEIRELREAVKYPPSNSKYRIFIIDEVHMLTREAFNALLKTLEEPPPHVIFMMATTDDHKIPVTIKSRTQKFDFKLISKDDISKYLIKILNNEKINHDDGIHLISQKANGSLRDALSLLDQVIAYANETLNAEMIRDILGIIEENVFLGLLILIDEKKHEELTNYIKSILNDGYSISNFISGFNEFIRNCMLHKSENTKIHDLSENSINWLDLKCHFKVMDIIKILDLTLKFEANLKNLLQPEISLEVLFLKLIFFENPSDKSFSPSRKKNESTNIENPIITNENSELKNNDNKDSLEEKLSMSSNEDAIKSSNLTLETIKNAWTNFINELEKQNSKYSLFLEDSNLISFDGNKLCIELLNGNRFQQDSLEKDIDKIETVFKNIYDKKIEIEINLNDDEKKNPKKEEKTKLREHPLFEKVIESFNGEIIR